MSNIDKRVLREAAEKATPGRIGDRVDGSIKYTCRGTDGTLVLSTDNHDDYGFVGDNSPEDELFFRLCDPVTVLALLDELEAVQTVSAARLVAIDTTHKMFQRERDRAEKAEKRIAGLSHHLQCAHAFIEHTEAFGHAASNGILCCGDAQWNIDESKSALAAAGKGEAS